MNVELFAAFLLAALVIQFTPGPGMLFIITQGLTGGSRAGRVAACGAASGMLVHTCAVVLGLAAVRRAAPMAMDLLRSRALPTCCGWRYGRSVRPSSPQVSRASRCRIGSVPCSCAASSITWPIRRSCSST
jgi:hypothetical protein